MKDRSKRVACEHCRKPTIINMNGYCLSCVGKAGEGERLRGREKCPVEGCQNYTDQGRFVGSLCAPCHDYLSLPAPNGNTSQAFRNEDERFYERLRACAGDFAVKLLFPDLPRFANRTDRPTFADAELAKLANLARGTRRG